MPNQLHKWGWQYKLPNVIAEKYMSGGRSAFVPVVARDDPRPLLSSTRCVTYTEAGTGVIGNLTAIGVVCAHVRSVA
jgi:hypothetical protein